ncbi:MAG TPA: DNA-binding response regulator, partial [Clostridium sp.]|nr:DNA-binding response regulator [Clostridium sp.]
MYQLLIVDDEVTIRTSLANYFPWEQEGFEVAGVCEDGREG